MLSSREKFSKGYGIKADSSFRARAARVAGGGLKEELLQRGSGLTSKPKPNKSRAQKLGLSTANYMRMQTIQPLSYTPTPEDSEDG